jgi:hypothetical protein
MRDEPDWVKQRRAELMAKAPKKKPATRRRRVLVDLDQAAKACKVTNNRKAFVWLWLQNRAWLRKSQTVTAPNGELAKYGVDRKTKTLALRQFEVAGLISVEWPPKKSPVVTLP